MEARAIAKYLRISPSKVRIVADLVRGKPVKEALAILRYTPKRASHHIYKVISSAAANAENNFDMDKDTLMVSEIYVDEGAIMKRYHPRQRGRAFPIQKKTSHITVVVREREEV